jgi:hypothetical protein
MRLNLSPNAAVMASQLRRYDFASQEDWQSSANSIVTNLQYGVDGWYPVSEGWAYASASTITVPTGAASRFQKGDKLAFVQTTVKYFYITSVTDTLLTVNAGTDYTVANAAISDVYISRVARPLAFPQWFIWSPTLVGFVANPTNCVYRFKLDGIACTAVVRQGTNGTSNANNFTISAPITARVITDMEWNCGFGLVDNSLGQASPAYAYIGSGGTVFTLCKDWHGSSTGWTIINGKRAFAFRMEYDI